MANIRDRGYIHVYIYICDNLYVICFNEKYNMPSGTVLYCVTHDEIMTCGQID